MSENIFIVIRASLLDTNYITYFYHPKPTAKLPSR